MVKAVILDIDGVIVGEKIGFNSPYPHPDVLKALKEICSNGTPIALCTAKPYYAIPEIIQGANLNNPHITDAGAMVIDPIDNIVVEKHLIDPTLAKEVIQICIANNVYVEFYNTNNYCVVGKATDITPQHTHILQKEPMIISELPDPTQLIEVTKVMPIALNEEDRERVDALISPYKEKLSISWGVHPVALPLQFGIITALNSSKKEGAEAIVKSLNISFENILGIGDSTSDWSFMQLCGYAATLENGSKDIQELVKTKGSEKYFVGRSVDENGILGIFQHFSL